MIINPIKNTKIRENIYAIRSGISNFYIINTGKTLIAFDTGTVSFMSSSGLKEFELNPNDVKHVFLTHSDYDHTGGLEVFKNAKVYISKLEEPLITGQKPRLLFKYNKKIKDYNTLKDKEVINIDDSTIKVISTPGHTIGSCCYLVNNDILLTGDTLRTSNSGKITPFLFFQNMSHEGDKRSLEMLKREGILDSSKLILTGHTGFLERQ